MEYQQGEDREQLTLYSTCLDDMVPADNSVRFIDQFVEQLDLQELGFNSLATQGRPPYHPVHLPRLPRDCIAFSLPFKPEQPGRGNPKYPCQFKPAQNCIKGVYLGWCNELPAS